MFALNVVDRAYLLRPSRPRPPVRAGREARHGGRSSPSARSATRGRRWPTRARRRRSATPVRGRHHVVRRCPSGSSSRRWRSWRAGSSTCSPRPGMRRRTRRLAGRARLGSVRPRAPAGHRRGPCACDDPQPPQRRRPRRERRRARSARAAARHRGRRHRAGRGLRRTSLAIITFLTRSLFDVPFEFGRLAHVTIVLALAAAFGEAVLPDDGGGRAPTGGPRALVPLVLLATRFLRPQERAAIRRCDGTIPPMM